MRQHVVVPSLNYLPLCRFHMSIFIVSQSYPVCTYTTFSFGCFVVCFLKLLQPKQVKKFYLYFQEKRISTPDKNRSTWLISRKAISQNCANASFCVLFFLFCFLLFFFFKVTSILQLQHNAHYQAPGKTNFSISYAEKQEYHRTVHNIFLIAKVIMSNFSMSSKYLYSQHNSKLSNKYHLASYLLTPQL